jgi:hypothetical protein
MHSTGIRLCNFLQQSIDTSQRLPPHRASEFDHSKEPVSQKNPQLACWKGAYLTHWLRGYFKYAIALGNFVLSARKYISHVHLALAHCEFQADKACAQ